MNESEFEALAQRTLTAIATAVEAADDDVEVDLESGVLSINIDGVGVFLVNKHAPLKQLWVSSPMSGAGHFAHDGRAWVNTRGGKTLRETLSHELSQSLGKHVVVD